MSSAYATTSVPIEHSRAHIEKLLRERGVTDTRFTTTASLMVVEFNWPLREKTGTTSRYEKCPEHNTYHRHGQRGRRVWDEFAPQLERALADGHDLSTDLVGIAADAAKRALPDGRS